MSFVSENRSFTLLFPLSAFQTPREKGFSTLQYYIFSIIWLGCCRLHVSERVYCFDEKCNQDSVSHSQQLPPGKSLWRNARRERWLINRPSHPRHPTPPATPTLAAKHTDMHYAQINKQRNKLCMHYLEITPSPLPFCFKCVVVEDGVNLISVKNN